MMYIIVSLKKETSEINFENVFALRKDAIKSLENIKNSYPDEEIIGYDEDELAIEDEDGETIYTIEEIKGPSIVIEGLTNTPLLTEKGEVKIFEDEDEEELEEVIIEEIQFPKIAHII